MNEVRKELLVEDKEILDNYFHLKHSETQLNSYCFSPPLSIYQTPTTDLGGEKTRFKHDFKNYKIEATDVSQYQRTSLSF